MQRVNSHPLHGKSVADIIRKSLKVNLGMNDILHKFWNGNGAETAIEWSIAIRIQDKEDMP